MRKGRFVFNNKSYDEHIVRQAACRVYGVDCRLVSDRETLQELVDRIVYGDPSVYSKFIKELNGAKRC